MTTKTNRHRDATSAFHAVVELSQNKQMTQSSFESSRSLDQEIYSTADMSDDMHDILSPSFDSFHEEVMNPSISLETSNSGEQSRVTASYSVDSIIRRVEEEIATARKAASGVGSFSLLSTSTLPADTRIASNAQDYFKAASGSGFGSSDGPRTSSLREVTISKNDSKSPLTNNLIHENKFGSPISSTNHHLPSKNHQDLLMTFHPSSSTDIPQRQNRQQTSIKSGASMSIGSLSDDDLQEILGVDDIEEKKTALEPFSRNGIVATESMNLNTINPTHLTIAPSRVFDRFEQKGRYGHIPVPDIRNRIFPKQVADSTDRTQYFFNSRSPKNSSMLYTSEWDDFGKSDLNFRSMGIRGGKSSEKDINSIEQKARNQSLAYQYDVDSQNVPQRCQHQLEDPTRVNTDAVVDSIYFTDEEWQIENYVLHSTDPSSLKNKKIDPEGVEMLLPKKDNGLQAPQKVNCGTTGSSAEQLSSRSPENLKHPASSPPKCASLRNPTVLIETDNENEASKEINFRLDSTNTPANNSATCSSHPSWSQAEGEKRTTIESTDSRGGSAIDTESMLQASVERVEDEFPIVQKSSTEDAIVSVQHHPVFQKRISAVDSSGYEIYRTADSASKRPSSAGSTFNWETDQPPEENSNPFALSEEEMSTLSGKKVATKASTLNSVREMSYIDSNTHNPNRTILCVETNPGCPENSNVDVLPDSHEMSSNEARTQHSSFQRRTTPSEWDKASELLYRLKEQRVSFSASFSPSHSRIIQAPDIENSSGGTCAAQLDSEASSNVGSDGVKPIVLEGESSKLAEDSVEGDLSLSSNNPNVRSPRYFNFMRVKRAKLRAKKLSTVPVSTSVPVSLGSETDEDTSLPDDTPSKDDEIFVEKPPLANKDEILSTENMRSEFSQQNPNQTQKMESNTDQVHRSTERVLDHLAFPLPKQADPPMGESVPRRCSTPEKNVFLASTEPSRVGNQFSKRMLVGEEASEKLQLQRSPNVSGTWIDSGKLFEIDKEDHKSSRRIHFRHPFPIVKPPTTRRDPEAILYDHRVEFPDMPTRWVKPKKELKQLIVAAMGTSLARRSNACGALKILSRHKKNQLTLARTDGFLTAITFAASQALPSSDRILALDARTRAVAALRNVCLAKDNRALVLKHPGVVESFLFVIQKDEGEGRALATSSLALLAKTPNCREVLSQVEGLVDVLASVMRGCLLQPLGSTPIGTRIVSLDGTLLDECKSSRSVAEEESGSSNSGSSIDSNYAKTRMRQLDDEIEPVDSIRHQSEEKNADFFAEARSNSCATLVHLSKQCNTAHQLCCNNYLLESLVDVSNDTACPLHSKCLEIICNLTRFHVNNGVLSRSPGVIDTLVAATNSSLQENRLASLRSLQNMTADASSKSLLATSHVLTKMISCAMRKDVEEKEVAVAAIYNISTEPSAVAAITNTKNVVATLVHLAHNSDSSAEVRLLACEALSTISLWLQTLAGTGKVPVGVANAPLPSQKTSGWQRWD